MILDEIVAHKRIEIDERKQSVPLSRLLSGLAGAPPPVDFHRALARPGVSLIAEIKRASPSKGLLKPDLDPAALASTYAANGASAISVLTDEHFFRGSLPDLAAVRHSLAANLPEGHSLPVLRKDFILDAYQVYESRAAGADAILLIAAILTDIELAFLNALARELDMSVLVEVHDREEMERALRIKPRIVGINNRNLRDFSVNLETFGCLRQLIPAGVIAVAESGIHSAADVRTLSAMGADAILVGQSLVTSPDPAAKVRELVNG